MQGLSGKMGVLFPILLTGKATVKVKGNVLAKALGLKKKAPIEFVEELSFKAIPSFLLPHRNPIIPYQWYIEWR